MTKEERTEIVRTLQGTVKAFRNMSGEEKIDEITITLKAVVDGLCMTLDGLNKEDVEDFDKFVNGILDEILNASECLIEEE